MKKQKPYRVVSLLTLIALLMPLTGLEDMDASEEKKTIEDQDIELLKTLEERMGEIETVSAAFTQEKELAVLERTMIIKGQMALEEPDNIAWHVDEPVRYRMIIRDSSLKQWDEDTDRVQEMDMDHNNVYRAMFQQLTAWFSGRYEALLEHYELEVKSREPVALRFTPRADTMFEEVIENVDIFFRKDMRYIEKIKIYELSDNFSVIRFKDTILDEKIEESVWEARP